MKVFWLLISLAFFVGSFALFGYAFEASEIFGFLGLTAFPFEGAMFFAGILAVVVSLAIPFHLLDIFD